MYIVERTRYSPVLMERSTELASVDALCEGSEAMACFLANSSSSFLRRIKAIVSWSSLDTDRIEGSSCIVVGAQDMEYVVLKR